MKKSFMASCECVIILIFIFILIDNYLLHNPKISYLIGQSVVIRHVCNVIPTHLMSYSCDILVTGNASQLLSYIRFYKKFSSKTSANHWRYGVLLLNDVYRLHLIKNVFIGPSRELIYERTLYTHPNYFEGTFFEINRVVVDLYNSTISGFDFLCTFYGDMYKIFPVLLLYPASVINNSVFPVYSRCYISTYSEIFSIFGLNTEIRTLQYNELYFSYNAYLIFNDLHFSIHFNELTNRFSRYFKAMLNLSNMKPSKYVLLNRKPGGWRYIKNFRVFVQSVRKQFSSIKWTIYPSHFETMYMNALYFAKVRFICMMAGSNTMHLMFSSENIGQVIICSVTIDLIFIFSVIKKIWTEVVLLNGFEHYEKTSVKLNPITVLPSIGNVIYAILNMKWRPFDKYSRQEDYYFNISGRFIASDMNHANSAEKCNSNDTLYDFMKAKYHIM